MAGINLLEALIANDAIVLNQKAADWQGAIKATFAPLIKSGAIKESYVQAVIQSVKDNGPYFIVDEHVAMPHARPENGAVRDAFTLVTLSEPVVFPPDTRQIRLLIGLSATSADIHVAAALPQVVALLESKTAQDQIIKAKSKEDVISAIRKVDLNKYLK